MSLKNNQGNQGYSGNKNNVIQGQKPDMENRHTQQKHEVTKFIHTKQQKQMSNSDTIKNWEHGPGAPVR